MLKSKKGESKNMVKLIEKRNSFLITISYLVSVSMSQTFIYGLLFYNRETIGQSTAAWAIIYSCSLFPGALVNSFVGVFADIYSKKNMMLKSEAISAVFLAIFTYMFINGLNSLSFLCLYVGFISVFFAFFEIPLDASVVNIAGSNSDTLVSIIWMSRAISSLIGPILGKALSSTPIYLFYLNTASFVISVFLQYLMSFNENLDESRASASLKELTSYALEDIKNLFSYIDKNKVIGFLLALNLVIAIFYVPVFGSIAPDFCQELSLGEDSLAYIESASWFGVIVGSIVIVISNMSTLFLKNLFNLLQLQSIFLGLWLFPLFINAKSYTATIFILLAIIDGAILTLQNLGALTYFQTKLPENMRGKVLGAMRTVMKVTAPLGILIYGVILEYLSWYTMMIFSVIVMLSASLILGKNKIFQDFISE